MKMWIERFSKSTDWRWLPQVAQWIVNQGVAIQQIPAPTFEERQRAEYVRDQFIVLGLVDVEIDSMHNVYGRLPGQNRDYPAVMISAHTDTVFNAHTDLTIRRERGLIYGPGLGDNSMGVAGLLGLVEALRRAGVVPAGDLWLVATSGEEGLGDLYGMRAAYDRLKDVCRMVINIEGLALGHIYHAGIAVKRLKIIAHAEGGHSWLHFGKPSANHALMQLGARITSLRPPANPRTTYNIGMIEGGMSVNTIAPTAWMLLDLRSEAQTQLDQLEEQVRAHVRGLTTREQTFSIEVVGNRPAGSIPAEHPLVQGAISALEVAGLRAALENGSTDGNIPLAAGCPTVTVGITRGGNAHRLDEYIETAPVEVGIHQLVLLALAVSAYQSDTTSPG